MSMRFYFIVVVLTFLSLAANALEMQRLLTYAEVIRLTKPQRIEYMQGLTKILILLEEQQTKYEIADNRVDKMKSQVAELMRQIEMLPEAEADMVDAGSANKTLEHKPGEIGPFPGRADPPPSLSCAVATQPADACVSAKPTAADIAEYRKVAGHGECIRGGFFSKYDNGAYRSKGCRPGASKAWVGAGSKIQKCPKNEELCNPALFCYSFDSKVDPTFPGPNAKSPSSSDKNKTSWSVPNRVCAQVSQNFTADCEKELNKQLGKPLDLQQYLESKDPNIQNFAKVNQGEMTKVCDPAEFTWIPFHDLYDSLIASTKKSYETLCSKKGFKKMFCTECEVIGRRIAAMNCKVGAPNKPPEDVNKSTVLSTDPPAQAPATAVPEKRREE